MSNTLSCFQEPEDTGSAWQEKPAAGARAQPCGSGCVAGAHRGEAGSCRVVGTGKQALMISSQ